MIFLGAELNFNEQDEHENPEQEETQEEEAPESGEEAPEEETEAPSLENRLMSVESTLSELTNYLRSQSEGKPAAQERPADRPAPDFGGDTVAKVIWDELQSVKKQIREPWERIERQNKEDEIQSRAVAALKDDVVRHVTQRMSDGDPKVKPERVIEMLVLGGQIGNPRVPITDAIRNAYNSVAFDAMKESSRIRGQHDVRKPDAKVPAFTAPRVRPANSQARPQQTAKPGDPRSRIKRDMESADAALSKLGREDLEDVFGLGE